MANKKMASFMALLCSFFIQGFCDIVGITSDYAAAAFDWSLTMSGFVPMLVFVWFLFLSVPVGVKVNGWGRKRSVLIGMGITLAGTLVPLAHTSWAFLAGYALIGIGNVVLQVSQNVLLRNVVSHGRLFVGSVTAGQVVKAVSSFCGPLMVLVAVRLFGGGDPMNWYMVFPLLGMVTLVSGLWIYKSPFTADDEKEPDASIGGTLALLKNKTLLALFIGMFFVVATDVGANFISSKIMLQRYGWSLDEAGTAQVVYYTCRTLGAALGVYMFTRVRSITYFRWNITACVGVLALLALCRFDPATTLILIGATGFLCSCIFPVVYTKALEQVPHRANSVTGLMITAVAGGGIVTPIIGYMVDTMQTLSAGITVLLVCSAYLCCCAYSLNGAKKSVSLSPGNAEPQVA